MSNGNGFTPTQNRMLDVLADGMAHTRQELHACLSDELSAETSIQPHITHLRKRLRLKGQDILCEVAGRDVRYRHVRMLASAADGKR